jgi:hypothetical protein
MFRRERKKKHIQGSKKWTVCCSDVQCFSGDVSKRDAHQPRRDTSSLLDSRSRVEVSFCGQIRYLIWFVEHRSLLIDSQHSSPALRWLFSVPWSSPAVGFNPQPSWDLTSFEFFIFSLTSTIPVCSLIHLVKCITAPLTSFVVAFLAPLTYTGSF